ncbi:MAG: exonuclease domain-containing protein, partial [Candidatus Saccharimonadales bacterium]
VFVDIETNGLDHVRGRVIEVAAVRVEKGQVVREFNQLIDPETELPWFITNLTGITSNDLRTAPTFLQIADELMDILDGAVFVAHNVRFDYSFLKQEYKRLNRKFLPKQLCTVKLSRALYPTEKSHKLENLIVRHGFTFTHRHRAYDDAAVLWQFVQHARETFGIDVVEAAIAKQISRPALPKALSPDLVNILPSGPGVYIFNDAEGRPLYVGKSINIKKRVLSHFSHDHDESKEFKIAQTIHAIETRQTNGELEALLLESELVKELQPLYNRRLRKLEKLLLVRAHLNPDGYITTVLEEAGAIDPENLVNILAVYPRRSRAKESINELLKTYELCPKLCGLEKGSGACFLSQLGKCRGACAGKEPAESYNERLHTAFERQNIRAWPYKGPVLVQEKTGNDVMTGIVVDQWCIVGTLTQEPYCEPIISPRRKLFDLDTYKILQSYLGQKLSKVSIRPLDKQQLEYIGV